jgi:hypothetical protein
MLTKIKQKINDFEDSINLTKKYPKYFNKIIIRTTFAFVFIFLFMLIVTSGIKTVDVSCNDPRGCANPFYVCSSTRLEIDCQTNVPEWICEKTTCTDKMLPYGYNVGNNSFIYNYKYLITFSILILGFLVNHISYKLRGLLLIKLYKR